MFGQRRVPMALHQMVVDHADRLHEGVDDGRPDEFEAARREVLRDPTRQRGFGRHLRGRAEMVDLRLAVEEFPEQPREPGTFLHDLEIATGGQDGAFDLQAIAHDAGVLHQFLDPLRRIARNLFRIEAVEGAAEILALAQDGDPGQAGLEAVEHELLVERAVVVFRHAPFFVVIGDVERILSRPRAAGEAVGVQEGRGHSAALISPGNAKRAHAGLANCSSMPPAMSGWPAARASATRSSRSIARPRPRAVEPRVPSGFSPALTGMPVSGAKSW